MIEKEVQNPIETMLEEERQNLEIEPESIDINAIAKELSKMIDEEDSNDVPYSKEEYTKRFKRFGLKESEIALTMDELTDKTLVLAGNFDGRKQEKIPKELRIVGGNANFIDSPITDLRNLEYILGNADFLFKITDLKNLRVIGGNAYFVNSSVEDLGNLERIEGCAYFEGSKIADLKNLRVIGGYAEFEESPVEDLGNLERIGGDASFEGSKITNLKNLRVIGGNAYFANSSVEDLGNLKDVRGSTYITLYQGELRKELRKRGILHIAF